MRDAVMKALTALKTRMGKPAAPLQEVSLPAMQPTELHTEPATIPRLAMVCFLEGLEAKDLPLRQEVTQRVVAGLEYLNSKPALEAVALCLEALSVQEQEFSC